MNTHLELADAARQFHRSDGTLFVNHASLSPWPRVTRERVGAFAQRQHEAGPAAYNQCLDNERDLRRLIAGLLNAPSDRDISLLKNTSEGINVVANGIDWRDGDNIVTARGEFLSNRLAWERLEGAGVAVRVVDIAAAGDAEHALISAMDENTRLLAVSSVQWADGFRLKLGPLGAACRAAGACFFVDAIQQFGALRIDVQADRIDVLSAGSHKWQMGPEGMAVFYCREGLRDRLRLRQWGWHMLEDRFQFEARDRGPAKDGRRFEAGTPNRLGEVALNASLGLIAAVGPERVETAVLENTARLMDGLRGMPGVRLRSADHRERRSGIVNFSAGGADAGAWIRRLRRAGVVAIQRAGGIRLSPHFYQHGEDIERLLATIEEVLGKN